MADIYERLVQQSFEQDPLRSKSREPVPMHERVLLLEKAIGKGRPLLDTLSERVERPNDVDDKYEKSMKTFSANYDRRYIAENKFTCQKDGYLQKLGKEHVQDIVRLSGGAFKHERLRRVHTKAREQLLDDIIISEGCIDPSAGVFVGIQSYGAHDTNRGWQKLHNSDLLYWQWAAVAEQRNRAVDTMKQYWSYAITNVCTIAVIEDCLGMKRVSGSEAVFGKGSDQLAALARTPVGKRIPRLLTDYAAHLGCKNIKSATVHFSKFLNTWVILWSLEGRQGKESEK